MLYRNEWKYLVTDADLAVLEPRLKALMELDKHQAGGAYAVRSLYFDDVYDSCLAENEAGVDDRRKFRLRLYNADSGRIQLELKEKRRGFTHKESCLVSAEDCIKICDGRQPPVGLGTPRPISLLAIAMATRLLRPRAVVEYQRTAFVGRAGNVRVTFDRNIAASGCVDAFLGPWLPMTPILPPHRQVLEVKFDEFLPDPVAQALELGWLQRTAFSKYYLGRLALPGPAAERTREYEF